MNILREHDIERAKMAGLLPCPFCGGQPAYRMIGNDHTKKRRVEAYCTECFVSMTTGAIYKGFDWLVETMVDKWNRRVENEQQAFDNGRDAEKRTAGYGELDF